MLSSVRILVTTPAFGKAPSSTDYNTRISETEKITTILPSSFGLPWPPQPIQPNPDEAACFGQSPGGYMPLIKGNVTYLHLYRGRRNAPLVLLCRCCQHAHRSRTAYLQQSTNTPQLAGSGFSSPTPAPGDEASAAEYLGLGLFTLLNSAVLEKAGSDTCLMEHKACNHNSRGACKIHSTITNCPKQQ